MGDSAEPATDRRRSDGVQRADGARSDENAATTRFRALPNGVFEVVIRERPDADHDQIDARAQNTWAITAQGMVPGHLNNNFGPPLE